MAEKRPNNYFDDIPTSHRQIKVFMIIVLAYIFDQMDNMVLGYVAPSVMRSFGIGMQEFAPAQSLYFFGMMLGGIVAGVISDKFGRRKAFMLGCFTFSTATILTGMTDNIYTFTLWRALPSLVPVPSPSPIWPRPFPRRTVPSGQASSWASAISPSPSSASSPWKSSPWGRKPGAGSSTRASSATSRWCLPTSS